MKTSALLLFFMLSLHPSLFAQVAAGQGHYNAPKGIAVDMYDVVAYFTQNKAVKGKPGLSAKHENVTYMFSTQEHLEIFRKNPTAYLPQYGGWCAYAMGLDGSKVEIDPETFKVKDGKLYLFYNAYLTNTLPKWNKDEAKLQKAADLNWSKITQK